LKDCWSFNFGMRDYEEARELQKSLCFKRSYGDIVDTLLFMEHYSVYTLGSGTRPEDIKGIDRVETNIQTLKTDRGGGATYHGPGQLVVYPILQLDIAIDVEKYMRLLEEVIISSLGDFGVTSMRRRKMTGVWAKGKKIASIGIKASQGITKHGFSINATCDLSFFDHINACGFSMPATSIAELFDCEVNMASLIASVERNFGEIFDRRIISFDGSELDKKIGESLAAKIGI